MRPECVALKHHRGVALVWRDCRNILIPEKNAPGIGHVEPSDDAQEGGFSTAARTQQEKDFPRFNAEGYADPSAVCSPNRFTRFSIVMEIIRSSTR